MPKINDLDLKNWKEYGDILTDSLWSIDERDRSGAHNNAYHGNFIPQIPIVICSGILFLLCFLLIYGLSNYSST